MRPRSLALPVLLAVLAAPLAALAGDDTVPAEFRRLKKGLWETTTSGVDPGQAMMSMAARRLESLPPEKRAQMEAMLKQQAEARGGAAAAAAARTHQFCLTQEKLDKKDHALGFVEQARGECTREVVSRTASSITYHATCTHEGRASSMDFHYEMKSREAIAGSTTVEATVNGQPLRTTIDFSARWVGASCGDVK